MDYNNITVPSSTVVLSGRQTFNSYVLNGKIMVGSVIVFFVVVIGLICFHSYGRWLFQRHHRRRRAHQLFFLSTINTHNDGRVPPQALDLSVLKTIPSFVYSSTTHDKQLECAICLSEFEDREKGRLLPKCKHAFHLDCIDMWFRSHSNCPICRTPVKPDIPVQPPVEAVSVNGPSSASSIIEREEGQMGCSSSSLPPLELVSVLVEIPQGDFRRLDDMGLDLPEGSRFKAPGERAIALKRIWSI